MNGRKCNHWKDLDLQRTCMDCAMIQKIEMELLLGNYKDETPEIRAEKAKQEACRRNKEEDFTHLPRRRL